MKRHDRPETAMVGAARRLATELVVIIASAIHEMYLVAAGVLVFAAARAAAGWSADASIALIGHSSGRRSSSDASFPRLLGVHARAPGANVDAPRMWRVHLLRVRI